MGELEHAFSELCMLKYVVGLKQPTICPMVSDQMEMEITRGSTGAL